jgi:hypothetical protein
MSALRKRLAKDFDILPCPSCGHFQKKMLRLFWHYAPGVAAWGCFFLALPSLALFALWLDDFVLFKNQLSVAALWLVASVGIAAIAAFLFWLTPNLAYRLIRATRGKR